MQGRAIKTISLCMLAAILSGCVLQRSVRQGEASKNPETEPIKTSSLSEYIRAVYKLSNEAAYKQTAQRDTVLSQNPQLRELAARVESDATDAAARSQLVNTYIDHQLYWDAYHLLTDSQADDAEANLNLATIWDAWGQFELALKYEPRDRQGCDICPGSRTDGKNQPAPERTCGSHRLVSACGKTNRKCDRHG